MKKRLCKYKASAGGGALVLESPGGPSAAVCISPAHAARARERCPVNERGAAASIAHNYSYLLRGRVAARAVAAAPCRSHLVVGTPPACLLRSAIARPHVPPHICMQLENEVKPKTRLGFAGSARDCAWGGGAGTRGFSSGWARRARYACGSCMLPLALAARLELRPGVSEHGAPRLTRNWHLFRARACTHGRISTSLSSTGPTCNLTVLRNASSTLGPRPSLLAVRPES